VANGFVYFTESGVNKVGRLIVSPVGTTTVASLPWTVSMVATTSGVSTASTTFLSWTQVESESYATTSGMVQTTSSAFFIEDTVTVKAAPAAPPNQYNYVGGILYSANKLAILSPYLALIGLVTVITSALMIKAKRK
jgi:hypothetical protein